MAFQFPFFGGKGKQDAKDEKKELSSISIGLLGCSSSGKTTYIYGILKSMMSSMVSLGPSARLRLTLVDYTKASTTSQAGSGSVVEEKVELSPAVMDNRGDNSFDDLFSAMIEQEQGNSGASVPEESGTDTDVHLGISQSSDESEIQRMRMIMVDLLEKDFKIDTSKSDGFQQGTRPVFYRKIMFEVVVNGDPKCRLDIIDYAGELVQNAAKYPDNLEFLVKHLKECDAVILLADAIEMSKYIEDTYNAEECMFMEQTTKEKVSATNIGAALEDVRREGFTLLLALTKTDSPQVDPRISKNQFGRALHDLKYHIFELAFGFAAERKWSSGMIPVTVIGKKRNGGLNVDENNGLLPDAVLNQENIDTSILFCLQNAAILRLKALQSEKQTLERGFKNRAEKARIAVLAQQIQDLNALYTAISAAPHLLDSVQEPVRALQIVSDTGDVKVTSSTAGAGV